MRKIWTMLRQTPLFCGALAAMVLGGALLVALPKAPFSELENRPLTAWTAHSPLESGFDEATEAYLSDHFPGRDAFVRGHAMVTTLLGQTRQDGVLLAANATLVEEPVSTVTQAARLGMDTLCEAADTLHLPTTAMLLPTSAAVLAEDLPPLYTPGDQQPVIDALYALANGITTLDAGLMQGDASLYYHTDHHLTAEGAWVVYTRLCEAWGLTPIPAERVELPGFRGSYYARIPSPLIPAETFSADIPAGLSLTLDGEPAPLFNPDIPGRNKYAALLSEAYAHAAITGGTGAEKLLVLSDSYANAIVPLLAQHFARVDIIDPRYAAEPLENIAAEAGSTRMLALFGLNTFSNNRSLALLTIGEE